MEIVKEDFIRLWNEWKLEPDSKKKIQLKRKLLKKLNISISTLYKLARQAGCEIREKKKVDLI